MSTQSTSTDFSGFVPVIAEHVVLTPGVCGGKPRIAGHRIKVEQIAVWHEQTGLTPAEIVAQHPGLTLADVHAALAYYHDHRAEIDLDIKAAEEVAQRFQTQQPSLIEKIAQKGVDVLALSNAAALAYVRSGRCSKEDVERLRSDLGRRQKESPADPDLVELQKEWGSESKG
jgi:uncharacterized protein (DUF433 family)